MHLAIATCSVKILLFLSLETLWLEVLRILHLANEGLRSSTLYLTFLSIFAQCAHKGLWSPLSSPLPKLLLNDDATVTQLGTGHRRQVAEVVGALLLAPLLLPVSSVGRNAEVFEGLKDAIA